MTQSNDIHAPKLIFGIYPGGQAGADDATTIGTPDNPARVNAALSQLQAGARPFVVRGYLLFTGRGSSTDLAPVDVEPYLGNGRQFDLVLCYLSPDGSVDDWLDFIRETIRRYGPKLDFLQIGEEPNSTGPGGNGGFPNVREAVVRGVVAAKAELRRLGYAAQVGINSTPSLPDNDFWPSVGAMSTPEFVDALDYVALDFFADVFRPIPADKLTEMVTALLTGFRTVNLAAAKIPPSVPIHIGENGWPTGPERSYERQAEVVEAVIRTVDGLRGTLGITHYEHFCLRDADSGNPNLFYQFGLIHDDYTPKPAFGIFTNLIAELGA